MRRANSSRLPAWSRNQTRRWPKSAKPWWRSAARRCNARPCGKRWNASAGGVKKRPCHRARRRTCDRIASFVCRSHAGRRCYPFRVRRRNETSTNLTYCRCYARAPAGRPAAAPSRAVAGRPERDAHRRAAPRRPRGTAESGRGRVCGLPGPGTRHHPAAERRGGTRQFVGASSGRLERNRENTGCACATCRLTRQILTRLNCPSPIGLPHQNLQLYFQNLKALWQQQIFAVSNASPVFTGTGGRCTKFGAEALPLLFYRFVDSSQPLLLRPFYPAVRGQQSRWAAPAVLCAPYAVTLPSLCCFP